VSNDGNVYTAPSSGSANDAITGGVWDGTQAATGLSSQEIPGLAHVDVDQKPATVENIVEPGVEARFSAMKLNWTVTP
jgi:hypothetical protein